MTSKKLSPVGEGKSGPAAPSWDGGTSVSGLLVEHNRAVASGIFEPGGATREDQLAAWSRFFEIGARASELPAWANKPGLEERDGRLTPTMGGADRSAFGLAEGREELREAVNVMRSAGQRAMPPSRAAKLRMAEASFNPSIFQDSGSGRTGPER